MPNELRIIFGKDKLSRTPENVMNYLKFIKIFSEQYSFDCIRHCSIITLLTLVRLVLKFISRWRWQRKLEVASSNYIPQREHSHHVRKKPRPFSMSLTTLSLSPTLKANYTTAALAREDADIHSLVFTLVDSPLQHDILAEVSEVCALMGALKPSKYLPTPTPTLHLHRYIVFVSF